MYNMRSSDGGAIVAEVEASKFAIKSLVSGAKVLRLGATTRTASILAKVIDKEVIETEASFLAFGTADIWKHNAFSGYNSSKSSGWGPS